MSGLSCRSNRLDVPLSALTKTDIDSFGGYSISMCMWSLSPSKATSAAGDARDAAEAARTSTIEYAQLSDDCKEKIAASASAGVVFATQAEIDEQYETVIEPALGGDAIQPLTQDDIDWALSIINQ